MNILAKRICLLVAIALVIFLPQAEAKEAFSNKSYEAKAIHAFLTYCLPALVQGDSPAHIAEMEKLPRLGEAAEKAFLHGEPGKVFALPEVGSGIVFSAPEKPMCSVIIQKLSADQFIQQGDIWFGAETPFKMTKNEAKGGETRREYTAKMGQTDIVLFFSVRDKPVEGSIQAMITAGRATAPIDL